MNMKQQVHRAIAVGVVAAMAVVVLFGVTGVIWKPPGFAAPSYAAARHLLPKGVILYPDGWLDAARNGVPDFDQKQESWFDEDINWSWDAPLAIANALWYLDSVFEPSPVAPPAVSDHYRLVESYQAGVDDHDPANLVPLVHDLAQRMDTDAQTSGIAHRGTDPFDAKDALDRYLAEKGLSASFLVTLTTAPTFSSVQSAVRDGTLVVLLLGFWQQQATEVRLGGHWVTVAGMDVDSNVIYFADPFVDNAETGGTGFVFGHAGGSHPTDTHNDSAKVSYDGYTQSSRTGQGGVWGPDAYLSRSAAANFFGDMNNTADLAAFFELEDPAKTLTVKVEYALFMDPVAAYPAPAAPIAGLTASNSGPTTFGSVTTLTATVSAGTNVTYTWAFGDGTMGSGAVVTHTYPAAGMYSAVVTATNSVSQLTAATPVSITKANQTITFSPLPDKTLGDPPFTITATASSGLAVTFTTASTACSVTASGTVTLLTAGSCTITAHQSGNTNYNAAPDVSRTFNIESLKLYLPVIFR